MATKTKIEWCDHSASPWHGCAHKVLADGSEHPACANCYAETMAKRNPGTLGVWGEDGTRVASKSFHDNCRRWNAAAEKSGQRQSVFPSICDPFEEWDGEILDHNARKSFTINGGEYFTEGEYPECRPATMADLRRDLFRTIDACPWLDFLLLTKRPESVQRMWHEIQPCGNLDPIASSPYGSRMRTFRPNVWLGTSISDQATADVFIPRLLECRELSPVLFVSAEPLLVAIDLHSCGALLATTCSCVKPWATRPCTKCAERSGCVGAIDWVIVGGESGHNARPMHPDWARSIRDQCQAAGVPFLFKQWGEWGPAATLGFGDWPKAARHSFHTEKTINTYGGPVRYAIEMLRVGKTAAGRLLDGCEWNQFPEAIR